MALAQSPFSKPVFLFVALPIIFALFVGAKTVKAAAWTGWFVGVGFFALALFWIVQPFLVDVQRHGWMAPFALILMAGGLSLFWALAFGVAKTANAKGFVAVGALTGCWIVAEYLRSTLFSGFPWALLGYSWVETPIAQNAAWAGPHGLSLVTLLTGLSVAVSMPRGLLLSGACVAGLWGAGSVRIPDLAPLRDDEFLVRLIQPNADQDLKWDADWVATYYKRQLEFSAAPAETRPDVTIWPETAVPFILSTSQGALEEIARHADPAQVIMGIRDLEGEDGNEKLFNAMVLLGTNGAVKARYDKYHLVPFGEYIPFASWFSGLNIGPLTAENLFGFSPGPGPRLIAADDIPPFLPLICYEAIFPAAMHAPEGRPEWIVQVTNDAWFGRLTGPFQHLAQARMRAIEQGLPLARSANTGVSAMIDPYGRITREIRLGQSGFVDAHLPATLPETVYSKYGDLPALVVAVLLFGLSLPGRGRHKPLTTDQA